MRYFELHEEYRRKYIDYKPEMNKWFYIRFGMPKGATSRVNYDDEMRRELGNINYESGVSVYRVVKHHDGWRLMSPYQAYGMDYGTTIITDVETYFYNMIKGGNMSICKFLHDKGKIEATPEEPYAFYYLEINGKREKGSVDGLDTKEKIIDYLNKKYGEGQYKVLKIDIQTPIGHHDKPMEIPLMRGDLVRIGNNKEFLDLGSDGEPLLRKDSIKVLKMLTPEQVYVNEKMNIIDFIDAYHGKGLRGYCEDYLNWG